MSLMPTNEDRAYNQGYVEGRRSWEVFEAMYEGYMLGYRFRIAELEADQAFIYIQGCIAGQHWGES